MISSNPTSNTLTKRESTNREYLSKASLIGMCNLYGVDFVLRIVKRDSRKVKVTVDHLMIDEMSLIVETEDEKTERKAKASRMARNDLKSYEAELVNQMGDYLTQQYHLGYQLTKSRAAVKTLKMKKYRWIDPFNEEGFRIFGTRVIEAVYSMPSETTSGKHSTVRLGKENMDIFAIYCELVSDVTLLTPQGMQMIYGLSQQMVQISPQQQQQQEMMIIPQEQMMHQMYVENAIPQQDQQQEMMYQQYQNSQEYQEYQQPEITCFYNGDMYLQPSTSGNEEDTLPPSTASISTMQQQHIPTPQEIDVKNEQTNDMYHSNTTGIEEGKKIGSNENVMTEANGSYQIIYEWMANGQWNQLF